MATGKVLPPASSTYEGSNSSIDGHFSGNQGVIASSSKTKT